MKWSPKNSMGKLFIPPASRLTLSGSGIDSSGTLSKSKNSIFTI